MLDALRVPHSLHVIDSDNLPTKSGPGNIRLMISHERA